MIFYFFVGVCGQLTTLLPAVNIIFRHSVQASCPLSIYLLSKCTALAASFGTLVRYSVAGAQWELGLGPAGGGEEGMVIH